MNKKVVKKYLFLMLISCVLFVLFVVMEKSNKSLDITTDKKLSNQSVEVIKSLVNNNTVKFEVYSHKQTVIAKKIIRFFKKVKQINPKVIVEFIDPLVQPSKAKKNGVSLQGEIVLTFADETRLQRVNITELSETSIINAILRLQNNKDEWLLFAQGYGMRTIEDDTSIGLSKLLINLKKIGFHIARIPLNPSLKLPENVKVILLPNPTQQLDASIVEWLTKQSNNGISLLWLADVDAAAQPQLELAFDTLIGSKSKLDGEKYSAVLSEFPQHKIVENFNQPIYFAEALEVNASDSKRFITTTDNIPLAVSKQLPNSRLIVVGDIDFISNQYIDVAANKSLIIRIIDWLFYHDDRINIAVKLNTNTQLLLTRMQLISLSVVFLILIPLFLLVIAFKQRRANRAR